MVTLKDKNTNAWLGSVTYAQLQFLINELKDEYKNGQEYLVNRDSLEILKQQGAEGALTKVIEKQWVTKTRSNFTGLNLKSAYVRCVR